MPVQPASYTDEDEQLLSEVLSKNKPWTRGGITLPDTFEGELLVTLHCAR